MKKNLLRLMTGSLILQCSASFAQPILTATGTNLVIGESFTLNSSNYVSPGNSGASQTWNLASMSVSSQALTTIVSPSSTTFGASFPNANVAWDKTTSGGINYFKTSSAAFQQYGAVSGTTVIPYSDPEDVLHFPFAFNNTFSDTWAAQFQSSGYTFYRTGTTTVTADSYGTLITPSGTYTNVMRIHFVQVYQDSANIGYPYIITYNNDEYMWYKDGLHCPIAFVYTLTTSSGATYTGGNYLEGSTGIDNIYDFISSSNIFPNPAFNKVYVDFSLTENKEIEVHLINDVGQQVGINQNIDGVKGENIIQLDVATLPKGIYFVQLQHEEKIYNSKLVVK